MATRRYHKKRVSKHSRKSRRSGKVGKGRKSRRVRKMRGGQLKKDNQILTAEDITLDNLNGAVRSRLETLFNSIRRDLYKISINKTDPANIIMTWEPKAFSVVTGLGYASIGIQKMFGLNKTTPKVEGTSTVENNNVSEDNSNKPVESVEEDVKQNAEVEKLWPKAEFIKNIKEIYKGYDIGGQDSFSKITSIPKGNIIFTHKKITIDFNKNINFLRKVQPIEYDIQPIETAEYDSEDNIIFKSLSNDDFVKNIIAFYKGNPLTD